MYLLYQASEVITVPKYQIVLFWFWLTCLFWETQSSVQGLFQALWSRITFGKASGVIRGAEYQTWSAACKASNRRIFCTFTFFFPLLPILQSSVLSITLAYQYSFEGAEFLTLKESLSTWLLILENFSSDSGIHPLMVTFLWLFPNLDSLRMSIKSSIKLPFALLCVFSLNCFL